MKRKGNLLLLVTIFFFLVLTVGSLFTITAAQRSQARIKVVNSAQTNSFLSITRVCADAFKDDLETQEYIHIISSIDNPGGEINIDTYQAALEYIQSGYGASSGLERASGVAPNSWYHTLTDPNDAIDFAGVTDEAALEYLDSIIQNAEVDILVHSDFALDPSAFGNVLEFASGDVVKLQDIYFTVSMVKGSWQIEQDYVLSGEKMVASYEENRILFQIDKTEAECEVVAQRVTRLTGIDSTLYGTE